MVQQDAAPCHSRIEPPVAGYCPLSGVQDGPNRDRWFATEHLPAYVPYCPDPPRYDQVCRFQDDRRIQPVMDGMQDPSAFCLRMPHQSQLIGREDERLLAQHMESTTKGHQGKGCVGSRRCADIEKVERFGDKQRFDPGVQSGSWKTLPGLDKPGLKGISGGNDPGALASFPSGQMPIHRHISQANDGASQHLQIYPPPYTLSSSPIPCPL